MEIEGVSSDVTGALGVEWEGWRWEIQTDPPKLVCQGSFDEAVETFQEGCPDWIPLDEVWDKRTFGGGSMCTKRGVVVVGKEGWMGLLS
jgi:hypothetical protein